MAMDLAEYLEVLVIMQIFKNMEWFDEGVNIFVQIVYNLRMKKCSKFY